ncbi:Hypothetical predicted protein [Podarcis lilfordi]|uniref:Uncharacterized protein n=1 Tax=Podarcis lilfordi TaxID=74358 RepID=A0AA35NYC9_9SAUR|nr:Hypothetical predicted protein [Podarcis lilfordi]
MSERHKQVEALLLTLCIRITVCNRGNVIRDWKHQHSERLSATRVMLEVRLSMFPDVRHFDLSASPSPLRMTRTPPNERQPGDESLNFLTPHFKCSRGKD